MQGIDWSKAPEGATHWEPEGECPASWMRKIDTGFEIGWEYWGRVSNKWVSHAVSSARFATFIPRPDTAQPWTGEGLPPVGRKVILDDSEHGVFRDYQEMIGVEVAVLASFKSTTGVGMIVCALPDGLCGCFRAEMARPIRTPEQIAADEREAACEAMLEIAKSSRPDPDVYEAIGALYDAGYRKPGGAP